MTQPFVLFTIASMSAFGIVLGLVTLFSRER
jgi:hypothetical protein